MARVWVVMALVLVGAGLLAAASRVGVAGPSGTNPSLQRGLEERSAASAVRGESQPSGTVLWLAPEAGIRRAGFQERVGQPEPAVRFEAIDIFVDSGEAALAAYQVEVKATAGDVKLVGLEGGEHPAFAAAPHYDPAALHEGQLRERVVVAAFSTDAGLPKGRTRVARLHVQTGGDEAKYEVRLETAGGPDGRKIEAKVEWRPAGGGAGDRK